MNAITIFLLTLWLHTKLLATNIYDHVLGFGHGVVSAVIHVAMIPVRAVLWVLGCLHASWLALKSIWK